MNASRLSDVSLYELAINAEQPPYPLQISPTTFKSMVGTILELLVEQDIAATIWLKLPKGEAWEADIEKFCKQTTASYTLYILHSHQDTTAESRQITIDKSKSAVRPTPLHRVRAVGMNPEEVALMDVVEEMATLNTTEAAAHSFPIAADSQLKREYFLLVMSAQFCGLTLAHRPRTLRSKSEGPSTDTTGMTGIRLGSAEDTVEQKHPLLGLCSFEQDTLKTVLDGINNAIRLGQAPQDVESKLTTWDSIVAKGMAQSLETRTFSQLLAKQIQRQEELWRSGALYRRQSEVCTTLQRDHEELLKILQVKDEFVKTMGQELRTPLTSMKTALSLLNSPNLRPQQRQRYMDMLSQECDRQSTLITSVLDLLQLESTVDQPPMEVLRLIDIVPGVVSTYQPLAQEKGVMLAYTIPEDLPSISCLSNWLKQIVINLLHNSIKFTPSGGQVWVRAKHQGNTIQLEFRDTGVGIAGTEIPKIFDRFYRIRQSGDDAGGVGLGLSIVQQLLLRCGGSISVKSKPGEGSVFSVALPVHRP